MLLKAINVSWLITNSCNYDCGFCWRVLDRRDISLDNAKQITDKLAAHGTKKISWAGGEPLMWRGIDDLILHTSTLGIETMLITNGSLLEEVWPNGVPGYLNWLNLPLEGIGEAINQECGRASGHYEMVCRIIDREKERCDLKLKINTVATRLNVSGVAEILNYLHQWNIRRWKVFQFYPVRGFARKNVEKYLLEDAEFEQLRLDVLGKAAALAPNADIVFESNHELDRSYFTLAPDGSVYVSLKGEDINLGNLLSESVESIFSRPELDKSAYWERSKWVVE